MAGADVAGRVAETIRRHGLLAPGAPVLALLSGGADSTLLVVLLDALGHDVSALHVAHGLRGTESEADVEACRRLCAALDVPLTVVDGRPSGVGNLEAELREIRRAAAARVRPAGPYATGHSLGDRAETALYRLAASGGVRALPALRPRSGPWVRPLIELSPEEIRGDLRRRGLGWREDASNRGLGPARNRIRHVVLPALRTINPAADRNIARAAALAADERDVLDALAASLIEPDGSVDLDRLAAAAPALARLALHEAAARAGVALGHDHVEALRTLGRHGSERRTLPRGAVAERTYARLAFHARPPAPGPAPDPLPVAVPGELRFGPGRLVAELGPGAAVDRSLAGRLVARPLRPGDRLEGRRRTCAELLSRAHVPRAARPGFPVVEADGRLVCLPGVAVSAAARRPHGILLSYTPTDVRGPA